MRRLQLFTFLYLSSLLFVLVTSEISTPSSFTIKLPFFPGRPYETDSDDEREEKDSGHGFVGTGREFDLFDTRGGQSSGNPDERISWDREAMTSASSRPSPRDGSSGTYPIRRTASPYYSSRSRYGGRSSSSYNKKPRSIFHPVADWWTSNISPNIKNWPKIQCRVEPTTTLKIRKTFRPLKTIVRLGADFNTQLGVWQFKSSWEDDIIGGKLTLAGRELQLTKSWQLSVGAVEDLVTRLRFRAAVDLQTWKAYARVGFRTERLSTFNVMEGFTLLKQVPLDGNKGNVKLEVKANFALPEPEIEYSTETQRSLVGMGDIEVSIEELNLVLDY